jgi:amino acid permease
MLKDPFNNQEIIKYLKIFAFILLVVLLFTILLHICFGKEEKIISLVGALAILISALLASYSVMLNIENTNKIEKEKRKNDTLSNIHFLIQNLIDITSVAKTYHDADIGELKVNAINKIYFIFSKKLEHIEDKNLFHYLSDDELNHLLVLRLRLYDNVAMLNNYSQGIIIDNPSHYNDNINDIEKLSKVLLELLSSSHNIQLQKAEN